MHEPLECHGQRSPLEKKDHLRATAGTARCRRLPQRPSPAELGGDSRGRCWLGNLLALSELRSAE
jgi:hypothetical protein